MMDLYTPLYRHLLFPLWETARARKTPGLLHYLLRTQWRSTDELLAMQVGGLRRLLQHAHDHVPFYRRRLDAAGLLPTQVRDVSDLSRLPIFTREQAQNAQADLLAQGNGALLTKSTSGTTGSPFRFSYNLESEHWRQAVKLRGYGWGGYQPGQRTVHYWGPPAARPAGMKLLKTQLDRALRREVYVDCARQSEPDLRATVALLRQLRPATLVGFTQATVELARFIVQNGLRDWPAMNVLCGAERLYPQDRPILEQAFSRPGGVYETYGCREFMLIASECEAHTGLHVSMENLIVEILDEAGRPAAAGQAGHVVVTDLHNLGMPLIRYRTGDMAVAAQDSASAGTSADRCPCGRGLSRISSLEGRQADLLRGRDGRGIPGIIFNSVFANLGGKVGQFQAVQRRDGHIDLKVVPGPEFDDSVVDSVLSRLRPYLGDTPLSVAVVGEIPPQPSGKRRHVVIEA